MTKQDKYKTKPMFKTLHDVSDEEHKFMFMAVNAAHGKKKAFRVPLY